MYSLLLLDGNWRFRPQFISKRTIFSSRPYLQWKTNRNSYAICPIVAYFQRNWTNPDLHFKDTSIFVANIRRKTIFKWQMEFLQPAIWHVALLIFRLQFKVGIQTCQRPLGLHIFLLCFALLALGWHDIEFARRQAAAPCHVACGSGMIYYWTCQVAAPCNVASGSGITCYWIRQMTALCNITRGSRMTWH